MKVMNIKDVMSKENKKVKQCKYCGQKYPQYVVRCTNLQCGGSEFEPIQPSKHPMITAMFSVAAIIALIMAMNTLIVSITNLVTSKNSQVPFSMEKENAVSIENSLEEQETNTQQKNEEVNDQEFKDQEDQIEEEKMPMKSMETGSEENAEMDDSQLPENCNPDQFRYLLDKAEEAIRIETARNYGSNFSLVDMKYLGFSQCYELGVKKTASQGRRLYVIYQVKISNPNAFWKYDLIYCPVRFMDLTTDQEVPGYSERRITGEYTLSGTKEKHAGIMNPYDLYEALTIELMDRYDVQVMGEFNIYAQNLFLTDLSEVPEEVLDFMYQDSRDRVETYLEKNLPVSWKIRDFQKMGEAFMVYKCPVKNGTWNNKFIVVYSAEISNNGDMIPTTVYFPVTYAGIVQLGDQVEILRGEVYEEVNKIPSNYRYDNLEIVGLTNGTSMYKYVAARNKSDYKVDASESILQFCPVE